MELDFSFRFTSWLERRFPPYLCSLIDSSLFCAVEQYAQSPRISDTIVVMPLLNANYAQLLFAVSFSQAFSKTEGNNFTRQRAGSRYRIDCVGLLILLTSFHLDPPFGSTLLALLMLIGLHYNSALQNLLVFLGGTFNIVFSPSLSCFVHCVRSSLFSYVMWGRWSLLHFFTLLYLFLLFFFFFFFFFFLPKCCCFSFISLLLFRHSVCDIDAVMMGLRKRS